MKQSKHHYIIHLLIPFLALLLHLLSIWKLSGGENIRDKKSVCADSWIRPQSSRLKVRMIIARLPRACRRPGGAGLHWGLSLGRVVWVHRSLHCWVSQGKGLSACWWAPMCNHILPTWLSSARQGRRTALCSQPNSYTAHIDNTHIRYML